MNSRIADLVAALPEELHEPVSAQAELTRILADLARRPVPTGRVHRAWSLGTLSAKIAAATSSRPTQPGGSARRSAVRSPTKAGRSGSR